MPKNGFLASNAGWSITLLRMLLGGIFFMEGSGKILGWFGKGGFDFSVKLFADWGFASPENFVFIIGWTELLAGILLMAGLLTRLAAVSVACVMFIIVVNVNHSLSFYFPLLVYICTLVLVEQGGGRFSVDSRICSSK